MLHFCMLESDFPQMEGAAELVAIKAYLGGGIHRVVKTKAWAQHVAVSAYSNSFKFLAPLLCTTTPNISQPQVYPQMISLQEPTSLGPLGTPYIGKMCCWLVVNEAANIIHLPDDDESPKKCYGGTKCSMQMMNLTLICLMISKGRSGR